MLIVVDDIIFERTLNVKLTILGSVNILFQASFKYHDLFISVYFSTILDLTREE